MSKIAISCAFLFLASVGLLRASPLEAGLTEYAHLDNEAFLAEFSLHSYIPEDKWLDTAYFATVEQKLQKANRPMAQLFLGFCEHLLEQQEALLNAEHLPNYQRWFEMAEFSLAYEGRFFEISSDMLFSVLAENLQRGIDQEKIDPEAEEVSGLIEALKQRQYGISIPVSNVDKGLHHLEEGNWGYLINRVSTDYPIPFYLGISLFGIGIALLFYRLGKKLFS